MYVDSAYNFNENLLNIRFPEFNTSISFVTLDSVYRSIPEIPKNEEVLTILMIDNVEYSRDHLVSNYDLHVSLIVKED